MSFNAIRNGGGDGVRPGVGFFGYGTGKYYAPTIANTSVLSTGTTANRVWYAPFWCQEAHTFTGIGIYQSGSGVTGNARFGVFANSGGLPGALVIDAGVAAFPGSTGLRIVAASIALSARTAYWLAMVADAALVVHSLSANAADYPALTQSVISQGAFNPEYAALNGGGGMCYAALTYGALPSTATAPTADADNGPPLILLKG